MSPLCSHCGAKVPRELLFSESEKRKIEEDERLARERIDTLVSEKHLKLQDDLSTFTFDGFS